MIEQGRQYGAIALVLERYWVGRVEQMARVLFTQGRRFSAITFCSRALDAPDRVMRDGVFLAQVLEERRQGGEAMPDGHATQPSLYQVLAPGDDVGSGHKRCQHDQVAEKTQNDLEEGDHVSMMPQLFT